VRQLGSFARVQFEINHVDKLIVRRSFGQVVCVLGGKEVFVAKGHFNKKKQEKPINLLGLS
jgi:hypothetical protein